jgi:hypothetical protein
MLRGRYASLDHADLHPFAPSLFYSQEHGEIWVGDAVAWLRSLESASADLVFADPPYNIKKAEWDTVESQEEYVAWSIQWIQEAAQVLKQNGTLYGCGFSEILADIKLPVSRYFQGCRWLGDDQKIKSSKTDGILPAQNHGRRGRMELTASRVTLFQETAKALKGSARRLFMARTVKELGKGGQRRAERELGWDRKTIRKGMHELASGITCVDAFNARGRKRAEEHQGHWKLLSCSVLAPGIYIPVAREQ